MSTTVSLEYKVVNPATGAVEQVYPTASDADVERAIENADSTFQHWRNWPVEDRAEVLTSVAVLFEERAPELGRIITKEMGKRLGQAIGEAEFCAEIFRYYAETGLRQSQDIDIPSPEGTRAVIQRRPIGTLLGVMPWNYPYYQVARFAAPNLMLGNTIILKHAESCPQSATAIESLLADAGLPSGAFVNLFASHAQIEKIIADPRVQGVSLTGSERAGTVVGSLAGRHLKKAVLELGGSDPYIVLDSDDITAAADLAWDTRMENMGQACNSNKRIIVRAEFFDAFVDRLSERARQMEAGDPTSDDENTYGPMASRAAAEALNSQVADCVDQGATLHAGGVLAKGPSAYFSPAVLTGVTSKMRAFREELFGPVAVVYRVEDDAEAVRLANDTPYGLGGAVFSRDEARAAALAGQLEVGMANVNTPAGEGAGIPFGGVKRSGFGRELGPNGMDEFANKRLLFVESQS